MKNLPTAVETAEHNGLTFAIQHEDDGVITAVVNKDGTGTGIVANAIGETGAFCSFLEGYACGKFKDDVEKTLNEVASCYVENSAADIRDEPMWDVSDIEGTPQQVLEKIDALIPRIYE